MCPCYAKSIPTMSSLTSTVIRAKAAHCFNLLPATSAALKWKFRNGHLRRVTFCPITITIEREATLPSYVFDHVGITTTEKQPNEDWVEASRIWVTNPKNHPEHIEFLRYEPDSTVPAAVRDNPHVAYRVESIAEHLAEPGVEVLIAPFIVGDFLEVAFVRKHGAIFEYMRYLKEGWFGNSPDP